MKKEFDFPDFLKAATFMCIVSTIMLWMSGINITIGDIVTLILPCLGASYMIGTFEKKKSRLPKIAVKPIDLSMGI